MGNLVAHKRNRMTTSKACLELFYSNPDKFSSVWYPWTKHEFTKTPQIKLRLICQPKKLWRQFSRIHIDYLQRGKTINGAYYSNLMVRYNYNGNKKRPNLVETKVLFHQHNLRVLKCVVIMKKFIELGYESLSPSPHPSLKIWLIGKGFCSNDEIMGQKKRQF